MNRFVYFWKKFIFSYNFYLQSNDAIPLFWSILFLCTIPFLFVVLLPLILFEESSNYYCKNHKKVLETKEKCKREFEKKLVLDAIE